MIADMDTIADKINPLCADLGRQSWAIIQGLFPTGLLIRLRQEALTHEQADHFRFAHVKRNETQATNPRGDFTLWLDDPRCGEAAKQFLQQLDALRLTLNRQLMLGLESIEAHFAAYPMGAGYARHRDRFRDDDARVLSLVCYLNEDWPANAGGALRLYLSDETKDIAPALGTTVLFLSAEIEHEVMPATQARYSISTT
jgi:SM-20-related protein